jgi:hydroxyacylglutathione hydrolase
MILSLVAGPLETAAWLVAPEPGGGAVLIDAPPSSAAKVHEALRLHDLRLEAILLTHAHADHMADAARLRDDCGVPVWAHAFETASLEAPDTLGIPLPIPLRPTAPDRLLHHDDVIACGPLRLRVLHVPGHTPGHCCFYDAAGCVLFSGDVLFRGSIGRTDFPGGSYDALMDGIVRLLLPLPDDTVVLPGHGPSTTIGVERRHNPFIAEYLEHFE